MIILNKKNMDLQNVQTFAQTILTLLKKKKKARSALKA